MGEWTTKLFKIHFPKPRTSIYNIHAMAKKGITGYAEKKKKRAMRPVIEEIVELPSSGQETEAKPQVISADSKMAVEEVATEKQEVEEAPQVKAKKDKDADEGFHFSLGFVFLTLIIAIIVAVVAGGLYVYFNGVNSIKSVTPQETLEPTTQPQATPSPQPSAKPSPAASGTPEPKFGTYKVSVLNGSGKIGEAGKVKTLIEKAGFKVATTGNADSFTYKETVVQVKASVAKSAVDALKKALEGSYKVTEGSALDSKSTSDIIITVGAE